MTLINLSRYFKNKDVVSAELPNLRDYSSVSVALDLSNNQLTDTGLLHVFQRICKGYNIKKIKNLNLSNNNLAGTLFVEIENHLIENQIVIANNLNLKGNNFNSISGLESLARIVTRFRNTEIDLSWNNIPENNLLIFFDKLPQNLPLLKLLLAGNDLTDSVGNRIIKAFEGSSSLSWVCISYNKMSHEMENQIFLKGHSAKKTDIYYSDNQVAYEAHPIRLRGGLYNECYKAKALYNRVDDKSKKVLLELDVCDSIWSNTNNPIIQLFMGKIWSAILGSDRVPEISPLYTLDGTLGIASHVINDFVSIYNSHHFKACFPLCDAKFVNLPNILSFAILSGNQDISIENIGVSSINCKNTFSDCFLYIIDFDSADFPLNYKDENINLLDKLINVFSSKKYLHNTYAKILEGKNRIDILLLGLEAIANDDFWFDRIDLQLHAIKNTSSLLNQEKQASIESKLSFINEYHKFLGFLKNKSSHFIEGLKLQKCIENKDVCEYDINSETKYHFVRLDAEDAIQSPISLSQYITQYHTVGDNKETHWDEL